LIKREDTLDSHIALLKQYLKVKDQLSKKFYTKWYNYCHYCHHTLLMTGFPLCTLYQANDAFVKTIILPIISSRPMQSNTTNRQKLSLLHSLQCHPHLFLRMSRNIGWQTQLTPQSSHCEVLVLTVRGLYIWWLNCWNILLVIHLSFCSGLCSPRKSNK